MPISHLPKLWQSERLCLDTAKCPLGGKKKPSWEPLNIIQVSYKNNLVGKIFEKPSLERAEILVKLLGFYLLKSFIWHKCHC